MLFPRMQKGLLHLQQARRVPPSRQPDVDGQVQQRRLRQGVPLATVALGDTIVALDGQAVRHMDELLALLGGDRVGASVPVDIVRGGQTQELMVTIGERP